MPPGTGIVHQVNIEHLARVVMTRNSDVFIPLGTRVAIANSNRNAIFVSIHFNSASRSGANGIETYYYRSDSASLAAFSPLGLKAKP